MVDFRNPAKSTPVSASLNCELETGDFQIERPDWTLFRSINTLGQKAGVPGRHLRRLALKELADNALDAGGSIEFSESGPNNGTLESDEPNVYTIEDDGPGIGGTPEHIARLFSINRDLVSSKVWRKPTRGALGNGLRVVTGCLIASGEGARLVVSTRNQRIEIKPLWNGGSEFIATQIDYPVGTRIEMEFGPDLPEDDEPFVWVELARDLSDGDTYKGSTSAHWYCADSFFELVRGAGTRPVRDFISNLDGCSGAKAGAIASAFLGRACESLSKAEAVHLLKEARLASTPPAHKRIGRVGRDCLYEYYGIAEGTVQLGNGAVKADIPFIVEAWAQVDEDSKDDNCYFAINRTPITGDVDVSYGASGKLAIWGCGLRHTLGLPKSAKKVDVIVNLTAPYIPITTDGKEPDLTYFMNQIIEAVSKAIRKARAAAPAERKQSIKDFVLDNLQTAIDKASGNGASPFSQRQVLYALRPIVFAALGRELTAGYFSGLITDYENDVGEIEGMVREDRGSMVHPHDDFDMPLGTETVKEYERPDWQFNKIIFIEKRGFFDVLQAADWPQRHDCALMTSKGFSTRAAKDLIDKLAEHDEPVWIGCVHDADSSGTMIYETLVGATKARGARNIEIVNLGLEPWEADLMGLEAETFEKSKDRRPVAQYVLDRDDGGHWEDWLQTHRYELNAMSSPQFIDWLTRKVEASGIGKVVPPADVIEAKRDSIIEEQVRIRIRDRILREAGLDAQVQAAIADLELEPITEDDVAQWFTDEPTAHWADFVEREAITAVVMNFED